MIAAPSSCIWTCSRLMRLAHVRHRHVAMDGDVAGLLVHRQLHGRGVELEEQRRAAERMIRRRPPCAPRHGRRSRHPGDPAQPAPARAAAKRLVVIGAQPSSRSLIADVRARAQDRVAHQHGRARRRRLLVVGHDRGVAHHDRHVVDRHAQLVGADLGEDRSRALADVLRSGVDHHAAVGQQADQRVRQAGGRARLDAQRDATPTTCRLRRLPADQLGRATDGVAPTRRRRACRTG